MTFSGIRMSRKSRLVVMNGLLLLVPQMACRGKSLIVMFVLPLRLVILRERFLVRRKLRVMVIVLLFLILRNVLMLLMIMVLFLVKVMRMIRFRSLFMFLVILILLGRLSGLLLSTLVFVLCGSVLRRKCLCLMRKNNGT